ncbi:hypothetical protein [Moraxella pluranimalium]|uniref:Uncharacterized protein n=1 Tax=Moraxella pluranimalium TaxID=470453 RepID=A0A1T0CTV1_9GAMM|nr:hypothetical protein [Moraxella pluranimalium]OOS25773.1 hypothetical protein B0680_02890 [Moraxella pluranimalium]
MNNKLITPKPNMHADIKPGLGAAGYHIGMDFNQFFQAISGNFIFQRTDIDLSLIKKDIWVVEFFSNEYYPDRKFASWNDSVILIFDNNTLSLITLKNEYKGKFLNNIGIGDKADLLLDRYYLHFYCEEHILAFKSENRQTIEKYLFDNDLYELDIDNDYDIMSIIDDIDNLQYCQDISFRTNYLAQYSIECSDQYIEEFYVY